MHIARRPHLLAALLALGPPALAQSFQVNATDVPKGPLEPEDLDFSDVDLDGDWDAALTTDEYPSAKVRLWINQGGLQGGALGVFLDGTALRLPLVANDSRDVELADVDGDADPDLYVANNSQIAVLPSRWWINQGGVQGGQLGFYADETAARWVGLGQPGSSLAPSLLVPSGGFVDWCGDAELADLDNDGDLDLVHSSFGGAWAGNVPTRVFLNDGAGFFAELNPSGFQLASTGIAGGSPALWCQGLQQSGTLDVTGAFADIAEDVDDFELADADGDFDVDVVLVGRSAEVPRFFRNRLEQGALAFRDESSLAFPGVAMPGWAYDQELADLDRDGDLDLLGMSWGNVGFFPFATVLENSGGVFAPAPSLPLEDFEENGDVLDYDADGDLDLFLAGTGVAGQLFENQGGSPIAFAEVSAAELPALSIASGYDARAADVDADGDADLFVHGLLAAGPAGLGSFLENATGARDSTPPAIPGLEALAPAAAAAGALPVRARVLDNASLDLVASYPADLLIEVDGAALPPRPMSAARGAIFRGTLPANLVGAVSYRVRAVDGAGNAGFSAPVSYAAAGTTGASYGLGAGASGGAPPGLRSLCEPHAGSPLYLLGEGLAGAPVFLGLSLAAFGPFPLPGLPDLILNIDPGAPLILVAQAASDAAGRSVFAFELPPGCAGVALYAQLLELAPGLVFGSSQGLRLAIL